MPTALDKASIRSGVRGYTPLKLRPLDSIGHKCNYILCPHEVDETLVYPCSPGATHSKLHGTRVITRCKKWDCFYCGRQKKAAFEDKLDWFIRFHNSDTHGSVLLTLTWYNKCREGCPPEHRNSCVALGHVADAIGGKGKPLKKSSREAYFRRFVSLLRKEVSSPDLNLEYCRVTESTQVLVDHYHIILVNVPRSYSERRLRNIASRLWHKITRRSYIVDVRWTYGRPSKYLSKYLGKGFGIPEDQKGRKRNYSYSNGAMLPPRVVKEYEIKHHGSPTPAWDEYRDRNEFKRHTDGVPSGGKTLQRQPCHHEGCALRFWHTPMRRANFDKSGGYERAMREYFLEQEDYDRYRH